MRQEMIRKKKKKAGTIVANGKKIAGVIFTNA